MTATGKKYHWERKNPAGREEYLRLNHEQNARRFKQVYIVDMVDGVRVNGFWNRPEVQA